MSPTPCILRLRGQGCFSSVVLKLERPSLSLQGFAKTQIAEPILRAADAGGISICILPNSSWCWCCWSGNCILRTTAVSVPSDCPGQYIILLSLFLFPWLLATGLSSHLSFMHIHDSFSCSLLQAIWPILLVLCAPGSPFSSSSLLAREFLLIFQYQNP